MENKKLWFRAKRFGYGWYPITWQGWTVIALFVIQIILIAPTAKNYPVVNLDFLLNFILPIAINIIFLFIICRAYGEEAKWSWGK